MDEDPLRNLALLRMPAYEIEDLELEIATQGVMHVPDLMGPEYPAGGLMMIWKMIHMAQMMLKVI